MLYFEPPRLHFEPLKLLNFDFNGDPRPAFRSNAKKVMDPDPAPQNNADLHPQLCILQQQFTIQVSENDLFLGNI
jgi:hypothetical protein